MKTQGRVIAYSRTLLFLLLIWSCSSDKNECSEYVEHIGFSYFPTLGDFNDALRVINECEERKRYISVFFRTPKCCVKGQSQIYTVVRNGLDKLDTLSKRTIKVDKEDIVPLYLPGSLEYIELNGSGVISFMYMEENMLNQGMDPRQLVLKVLYKERFYSFSGLVPLHEDWRWEDYYSFETDEYLLHENQQVYDYALSIWNNFVEDYKYNFLQK